MDSSERLERYGGLVSLLSRRRSCRSFLPDPVPDADVRMVMEAGLWAPSGHNDQSSRVVRIASPGMRERLRLRTCGLMGMPDAFDPFYGAPELLAVVDNGRARDMALLDGSMVAYNMLLVASELGLGSCWVNTAQYETELEDSILAAECARLGLEKVYGVAYVALGWPCDPQAFTRLPRQPDRIFTV